MSKRKLMAAALPAALLLPAPALAGTFTDFDPPGEVSSAAAAMNAKGDIAGMISTKVGYLRKKTGVYKTIAVENDFFMQMTGINYHKQSVGSVSLSGGFLGFVADKRGQVDEFAPPDADPDGLGTQPMAINDNGAIAGVYSKNHVLVGHGFLRAKDGSFTPFDAPGAGTTNIDGTYPTAINLRGFIAGYILDDQEIYHGFIRRPDGSFIAVDVAGAGQFADAGTRLSCMNAKGATAGTYQDGDAKVHGFLRSAGGHVTTFDVPGTLNEVRALSGLNAVVGTYHDDTNHQHGFVRTADGTFTTLDPPDAVLGSTATSINDKGWVAGFYFDGDGKKHSFLWKP